MDIRKDWINSLGVMLMSYATFTDGIYSKEEEEEIAVQLRTLCRSLDENVTTSEADADFITRIGEVTRWYLDLKATGMLHSEFKHFIEEIPKMDFWSKQHSVLACKAIYEVASADGNIVPGEADVLTDVMDLWDVSIEDIEDAMI